MKTVKLFLELSHTASTVFGHFLLYWTFLDKYTAFNRVIFSHVLVFGNFLLLSVWSTEFHGMVQPVHICLEGAAVHTDSKVLMEVEDNIVHNFDL